MAALKETIAATASAPNADAAAAPAVSVTSTDLAEARKKIARLEAELAEEKTKAAAAATGVEAAGAVKPTTENADQMAAELASRCCSW